MSFQTKQKIILVSKPNKTRSLKSSFQFSESSLSLGNNVNSNITTIESDKDIASKANLNKSTHKSMNQSLQISQESRLSYMSEYNYKTMYLDKCLSLSNLEKSFLELQDNIQKMIENAKNVSKSYATEVLRMKEFVIFIIEEYQNKNYGSIDYIVDFIRENKTVFNCGNTNTSMNDSSWCEYYNSNSNNNNDVNNERSINNNSDIIADEDVNRNKIKNNNNNNNNVNKVNYFMTKQLLDFINEKLQAFVLK